jgi:hypothetical protein
MPSRVLNFKTPIECLTGANSFVVPPKVFGCTCFVHDYRNSVGKLDPRAIKCIFVGYSPTQKGYRCWCPSEKKIFVSVDVTFLEKEPFDSFKGNDGSNVDVEGETSTNSNSKYPIFIHLQDKIQSEAITQGEDISGTNDDDQVHNLPPLSQVIENEGFIEDTCPSNNVSPVRLFDPDDVPRVTTSTKGSSLPSETTSDMMEETGTHNLTSPSIAQPIALRKARRHMDVPARLRTV